MLAICKILLINHLPIMDGEGLQFFLFFLRVSQALSMMMMMMLHYAPTDYPTEMQHGRLILQSHQDFSLHRCCHRRRRLLIIL